MLTGFVCFFIEGKHFDMRNTISDLELFLLKSYFCSVTWHVWSLGWSFPSVARTAEGEMRGNEREQRRNCEPSFTSVISRLLSH